MARFAYAVKTEDNKRQGTVLCLRTQGDGPFVFARRGGALCAPPICVCEHKRTVPLCFLEAKTENRPLSFKQPSYYSG